MPAVEDVLEIAPVALVAVGIPDAEEAETPVFFHGFLSVYPTWFCNVQYQKIILFNNLQLENLKERPDKS